MRNTVSGSGVLCATCWSLTENGIGCACASGSAAKDLRQADPAGGEPSFLGLLTASEWRPSRWHGLESAIDGPCCFAAGDADPPVISCWRHRAHTVWIWQASLASLPSPWQAPDPDRWKQVAPVLRVMSATTLLVLEIPGLLSARRTPDRELFGDFDDRLDRLEWFGSHCGMRLRAMATIDSHGAATPDDMARLPLVSGSQKAFDDAATAVTWLLEQLPNPAPSISTSHRTSQGATAGSNPREPTRLFEIGLVDVGGSVARHLLGRLHRATALSQRAGNAAPVDIARWPGARLSAYPSADGLHWARVDEVRRTAPASSDPVPPWRGLVTPGPGRPCHVVVAVGQDVASSGGARREAPLPVIVGIGPYEFFGRSEMPTLLRAVWAGSLVPAAMIKHARAASTIVRWFRDEFPGAREYPDTWAGGQRAVRDVMGLSTGLRR